MKVLALDLGSSQLKAMVIRQDLSIEILVTEQYPTYSLREGYIEQNPDDWEKALKNVMKSLSRQMDVKSITAISFSGHMSGLVCIDNMGKSLYRCIMLSDTRSQNECSIIDNLVGEEIKKTTGNPVINAFLLPKLLWLKRNRPDIYKQTYKFLFPKDYLRFLLTGVLGTDYTDAGNALCMKIDDYTWNNSIINTIQLDIEKFPDIHIPWEFAGNVTSEAVDKYGFAKKTKVYYGAADMACSAIGNVLFDEGESTLTFGTCATFLNMVSGFSNELYGKVTFHTHVLKNKFYALGSHFNGGLAINWFSQTYSPDNIVDYDFINKLSEDSKNVPPGSGGLITLPFLAGSGSPYYDSRDKQIVIGISTATGKRELFKSQLEGIAYNLKQTFECYNKTYNKKISKLLLAGGGCKISVLPQIIADIFNIQILTAENEDAATIGAALIGLYGEGKISDLKTAAGKIMNYKQEYNPDHSRAEAYNKLYDKYLLYYKAWSDLKENSGE